MKLILLKKASQKPCNFSIKETFHICMQEAMDNEYYLVAEDFSKVKFYDIEGRRLGLIRVYVEDIEV